MTLAMLVGAVTASAQVNVVASAGTGFASYTTLSAAFTAINAGTHQGVITIGISANTTEPAAGATLNRSGFVSASYTSIGIQPIGGAARTISGAITPGSALILLDGADNVTIDGLNTGGNSLTVANTTATNVQQTSTIRLFGGASNNVITNANIQGSATPDLFEGGGTIYFSTDPVASSGNNNNTISNNNIGPAGANLPSKAIHCTGSPGAPNNGNVINNNNIFDYFAAATRSAGVASTSSGCAGETITNNRFYQTAARTWTTGSRHTPIDIEGSPGGVTITGNIIGFASNTQTGTYTLSGAGALAKFVGIYYDGGTSLLPSIVSNNTIAAVSMTGVSASGQTDLSPFMAIFLRDGEFTSNGNVIGSQSATNSLVFSTTTTSSTDVHGILSFGANTWTSNNNTVGGISVTNLASSGFFQLSVMRASTSTAATWNATGNTVGGSIANSIRLTSPSPSLFGFSSAVAAAALTSNVVRNLTNTGTGGPTISGSLTGIAVSSSTASGTVSQNTISSLSDSNPAADSAVVQGINISGPAGTVVARNRIHGLTVATSSVIAHVVGIRATFSAATIRNNMIAIGAGIASAIGQTASNSAETGISGIHDAAGGTNSNNFLHNSVYIGGSPTAGSGASYAFNGVNPNGSRVFRDNIFVNARSNSGATGKNYAVKINGTAPNPTGLTLNNNVYFTSGTGGVFGFFNSLDVANLAAWQAAVGQDAASLSGNPQFIDPTNATPDLHLHPTLTTVAESAGADVGVTDDFDGQTRGSLSPVDIGADAGNFTGTQANLVILKSDGVATAIPGGSVTYSIAATNIGPAGVVGATVTDTFAGILTCTWTCSGTSGGTCTAAGAGNISDTVNLPVGGSITYTAGCNIAAAATGTLANTATVATPAGVTDPVPANNSATDEDTLTPQANLAIAKNDGVTTAVPGGSVTYTIIASNPGPSNAPGTTVADMFPASLTCTWTCFGTSGGTCTAAGGGNINDGVNLPVGGSVTYTANCSIADSASGTLSNTATVTAAGGVTDPASGNNNSTDMDTLERVSDLAITKTDGQILVNPGQVLTYTITGSNAGPSSATGATLTDTFPASLTGCSWMCAGSGGGTCPAAGSGNIAQLVNLPVGGMVTFTATCTVVNGAIGSITNTATIAPPAGTTDPNGANNAATDVDGLPIIFVSDFEEGDLSEWSSTQPLTLVGGRSFALDSRTEARFGYDFSAFVSVPELQASALATVLNDTGSASATVEVRVDAEGRLELRLVGTDERGVIASEWSEAAPVNQLVRLEWQPVGPGQGRIGVYLDGRLALWLDGLNLGTPAGLVFGRLLR